MKDIEINSDKYTVIAVLFCLTFVLLIFVSDLYAVAKLRIRLPRLSFWDYPVAIFIAYLAVSLVRESKIRGNYPYGVAGIIATSLALIIQIAFHWTKGFADNLCLLWSVEILTIAASGLFLVEGVRWLKRRVRLV